MLRLTEYWLSSLKVATVIIFIIVGILVNVGVNREHEYIGTRNWHIEGAPFVGGFGGFARVFVTASFACMYVLFPDTSDVLNPVRQMGGRKALVSRQEKPRILRVTCLASSSLCFGGRLQLWKHPDIRLMHRASGYCFSTS